MKLTGSSNIQWLMEYFIDPVFACLRGSPHYQQNMKQKVVLSVQMHCSKCRKKALQIVAETDGVNHFEFDGEQKEKITVKGEGFDAVTLAKVLRRQVGYTKIISMEDDK